MPSLQYHLTFRVQFFQIDLLKLAALAPVSKSTFPFSVAIQKATPCSVFRLILQVLHYQSHRLSLSFFTFSSLSANCHRKPIRFQECAHPFNLFFSLFFNLPQRIIQSEPRIFSNPIAMVWQQVDLLDESNSLTISMRARSSSWLSFIPGHSHHANVHRDLFHSKHFRVGKDEIIIAPGQLLMQVPVCCFDIIQNQIDHIQHFFKPAPGDISAGIQRGMNAFLLSIVQPLVEQNQTDTVALPQKKSRRPRRSHRTPGPLAVRRPVHPPRFPSRSIPARLPGRLPHILRWPGIFACQSRMCLSCVK